MKTLLVRSAYFSLGISSVVTAVATEWDWLKNPGGIFRDESGTNWQIVFDTAVSWFVPTLAYTFVAFAVAAISFHLLRSLIRKMRAKKSQRNKPTE